MGPLQNYLQGMSVQARRSLLAELERLDLCGSGLNDSEELLAGLRAEFRDKGQSHGRVGNPSRYFFEPLAPLLIDGAPEHANTGRIQRSSLAAIWDWISQHLLPAMARDYDDGTRKLILADRQSEIRQAADAFQAKVIRYLEGMFASPTGAGQIRTGLAIYTSSQTAFEDLRKMFIVLTARDALAAFIGALPSKIEQFEGESLKAVVELLDPFTERYPPALPFALTLVANRLKEPWQLIRLATKAARSKNVSDIAAVPYAIAISMVLDRIDDKFTAFRKALTQRQILVSRDILVEIYDAEHALRVRLDRLEMSDWGRRLDDLIGAVTAAVDVEKNSLPKDVRHVLGSRSLRRHDQLADRAIHLAWKGRDVLANAAAYCKGLIR